MIAIVLFIWLKFLLGEKLILRFIRVNKHFDIYFTLNRMQILTNVITSIFKVLPSLFKISPKLL